MTARRRDDQSALTLTRKRVTRRGPAASVPSVARKRETLPATISEERAVTKDAPERPGIAGPKNSGSKTAKAGKGNTGRRPRGSLFFRPTPVNVKLIYAGYLMSLAVPFLALVAAGCAWQCAKMDPPAWLATHYAYQMRTFWIGLVANIVAYALSFAGVGLLLFPLIAVWVVARAVKGLIRVARQDEIEEPNSYFV